MERFGGGRPPLSTAVLGVLKSVLICPPGAVFVRCDLPVLLHALLHVAIAVASRAMHFPLDVYTSIHSLNAEAELQNIDRRVL